MPWLELTPRLRSSPDSDRDSFAGARLSSAVDRRPWLCPSRRAVRRARATSGAVSLPLDRAAGRLRRPGRCPVDRRPLADLARASGATSPGSLAGNAHPPEASPCQGEPGEARRGGRTSAPRTISGLPPFADADQAPPTASREKYTYDHPHKRMTVRSEHRDIRRKQPLEELCCQFFPSIHLVKKIRERPAQYQGAAG